MKLRLLVLSAVALVCSNCSPLLSFQERLKQWTETHTALVKRYNGFPCNGQAYFGSGDIDTLVCIQACTPTTGDVVPDEFPSELAENEASGDELCKAEGLTATLLHPHTGLVHSLHSLRMTINVVALKPDDTCSEVVGARVELWQHGGSSVDSAHSCFLRATSDDAGKITFSTSVPFIVGLPPHINVKIMADGYRTLTTRLYFRNDPWFEYLTMANSFAARDPRAVVPEHDTATGRWTASATIVLEPSSTFLDGFWSDQYGLIYVSTERRKFRAQEYPHPRRWGTVTGAVHGQKVVDLTFRGGHDLHFVPSDDLDGEFKMAWIREHKDGGRTAADTELPWDDQHVTGWVNQASLDQFTIFWSDGAVWQKPAARSQFRHLRLEITQTTAVQRESTVLISELELYAGHDPERVLPFPKLIGAHHPVPYSSRCSAESTEHDACWHAFDGDEHTSWQTLPLPRRSNLINPPQWVQLDVGAANEVLPTGLRIVCDLQNAQAHLRPFRRCPRAFKLLGSVNGSQWELVAARENLEPQDFPVGGLILSIPDRNVGVRPLRYRCGSCDSSPWFSCRRGAFDPTCDSKYCGKDGTCQKLPVCPAGSYLRLPDRDLTVECTPCPAGRYGHASNETNPLCSGACPRGYYCPEGTSTATIQKCREPTYWCPEGSTLPTPVPNGYVVSHNTSNTLALEICPAGSYCVDGIKRVCPEGTYGDTTGLYNGHCTAHCLPGFHCPANSTAPQICPIGSYCPQGVAVECEAGRYGAKEGLKTRVCSGLCAPSYYCPVNSTSATEIPCPAGRYGATAGLKDAACTGQCPAGSYCAKGSTNTSTPCGSDEWYCPLGTPEPVHVTAGYYSIGGKPGFRHGQTMCEKGHYCVEGVKYECLPGTYGSVPGLFADTTVSGYPCSGVCALGHYCPSASTSPTQHPCPAGRYGSTTGLSNSNCTDACPPGHFCPEASIDGFLNKCPAGRFGPLAGHTNSMCSEHCSAGDCPESLCLPGFYCPEGSSDQLANECGTPDVYCPLGSAVPVNVSVGYYTVGPSNAFWEAGNFTIHAVRRVNPRTLSDDSMPSRRWAERICPVGHYCVGGERFICPAGRYGQFLGGSSPDCTGACPPGYYCPEGTVLADTHPCPPGRYGSEFGLQDEQCTGECEAGYYCPPASVRANQTECGGPNLFCPPASAVPYPVLEGFYTIGPDPMTQNDQVPCEEGHYCVGGIKRICRAGTYGATPKLSTPACSGLCSKGHYCPEGSISKTEVPCPAGRYGDREGLKDSFCSGVCHRQMYCPEGTVELPVLG